MLQLCGERVGSWLLRSFALKDSLKPRACEFRGLGFRASGFRGLGFRV